MSVSPPSLIPFVSYFEEFYTFQWGSGCQGQPWSGRYNPYSGNKHSSMFPLSPHQIQGIQNVVFLLGNQCFRRSWIFMHVCVREDVGKIGGGEYRGPYVICHQCLNYIIALSFLYLDWLDIAIHRKVHIIYFTLYLPSLSFASCHVHTGKGKITEILGRFGKPKWRNNSYLCP